MKKVLFIICIFCYTTATQAQDFSFQMFFTDAAGNKDTITLGYDAMASDTIDNIFGEINIISTPINSGLDVRITNEFNNRNVEGIPGTYHTKKQITFYNCMATNLSDINIQTIDIHTNNWPVTASWDNSLFADTCRKGSVFTGANPGGWWDVASISDLARQVLYTDNTVSFTSNFSSPFFNDNYSYIKNQDTIPVFWLAIVDEANINVSTNKVQEQSLFKIFPNPTYHHFSIQVSPKFGDIETIQLFSLTGQLVLTSSDNQNIDISNLSKGIYLVRMTNKKGKTEWGQVVRN